jgi:hypothetical protein
MTNKTISIFGMALGSLITIATIFMGLLSFPHSGFGLRKVAMGIFGLLMIISGVFLFFWRNKNTKSIFELFNYYSWISLFGFTFCAAYLYAISEWIFMITMPSFLNLATPLRKLGILYFTSSLIACLAFIGLFFFFLCDQIPWLKKSPKIFLALASLIPTLITTSLVVLLIDNFTYTIFKFGISTSQGPTRILYLFAYIILYIYIYFRTQRILSDFSSFLDRKKNKRFIIPFLVVIILASFLLPLKNNINMIGDMDVEKQAGEKIYPNIVLITGDGINADHTSVYGYERDTTPRLEDLSETSLVAENAFSNSRLTTSAILSIYTSKYPTQTRVLYPPDILRNNDSYEHLPGILKSLGYYTVQLAQSHFVDAYDVNLLSGFDYSNGRSTHSLNKILSRNINIDYSYFIYETSTRIIYRLKHIFLITPMVDLQSFLQGNKQKFSDQEKIIYLEKIFSEIEQPIFVHLHWMGTHGPTFKPKNQVFSTGINIDDQEIWEDSFYDDSILEFDEGVGQIIDFLNSKGLFDNTILIVSSDHGQKGNPTNRIPLLIHFPNGQFSGTRNVNIQQLDISPTLLEYFGIVKPSWMNGDSFLSGELQNRPIFSFEVGDVELGKGMLIGYIGPPFYQFGIINVVYCNYWFKFNLSNITYETGLVGEHTQPCNQNLISNDQFISWIIGHLKKFNFDTSKIELEYTR